MKKAFTLFYAVCICVCLLPSCSKQPRTTNSTKTQAPAADSMSVVWGGKRYVTNNTYYTSDATHTSVWGVYPKGSVAVYFEGFQAVGTYTVGTSWTVPTQITVDGVTRYAKYGTIIITATSPKLAGTFEFTCEDDNTVSEGKFYADQ